MGVGARRQFRLEGLLSGWNAPAERTTCKPMLLHTDVLGERRGRDGVAGENNPGGAGQPVARSTSASADLEQQWERISRAATSDGARRGSALVWLLSTGGRPGR